MNIENTKQLKSKFESLDDFKLFIEFGLNNDQAPHANDQEEEKD